MDIERLKELKAEFEKVRKYNATHCMSTVTEDDVLELIDEAITNQPVTKSATSEDVGMVIKLMQAYGKNITSKCQIEGIIFYDTNSPCTRHRFGEDTIDTIITALQAYQPTISKSQKTE